MKPFVKLCVMMLLVSPLMGWAQTDPSSTGASPPDPDDPPPAQVATPEAPPPPAMAPEPSPAMTQKRVITFGRAGGRDYGPMVEPEFGMRLGAWWKNSEIVSKLALSDDQVKKISQTFLDHRLKLIDLRADLEKQELRLQPLLDVDQPDEGKVGAQIDLITAARGRLEKENALMMLAIRRELTVDQWKKLQTLQEERRPRAFRLRSGGPRPPGGSGGAIFMKGPGDPK